MGKQSIHLWSLELRPRELLCQGAHLKRWSFSRLAEIYPWMPHWFQVAIFFGFFRGFEQIRMRDINWDYWPRALEFARWLAPILCGDPPGLRRSCGECRGPTPVCRRRCLQTSLRRLSCHYMCDIVLYMLYTYINSNMYIYICISLHTVFTLTYYTIQIPYVAM